MSYVFHPAAAEEHLESVAFYESKQRGLGSSYLDDFEAMMGRVGEAPKRYPLMEGADIRYAKLHHFPYTVYFRERAGAVQVLAVAHHRRRPGYWLSRL